MRYFIGQHSFASRRTQAYTAFLVCNSDRSSPGSGRVRRLAGPVLALLALHGAQKNGSRNPKPSVKQPIDIHRIIKIDLHDKRIKILISFCAQDNVCVERPSELRIVDAVR